MIEAMAVIGIVVSILFLSVGFVVGCFAVYQAITDWWSAE